jgi:hypothetical protein
MRHVKPHRWADAWAGKLPERDVAAMDAHAEECARCAKARDRITRVSSTTFPALRAQSSPEVGWDAVRAKVYWSVSTEKRARVRPAWHGKLAWGAIAAGATVVALASSPMHRASHEQPVASVPHVEAPAPLVGLVSRVSGDVMIDGLRRPDAFERTLAAGAVIATADGRVDVQFGDGSAFALGARSTLQLRRFDAEAIELVVDGTVDALVAPRAPHQRFVVIAGDDTIEVRGTQFRVARDASGVRVACRHGLVAVRDRSGELAVAAAQQTVVHGQVAGARVAALSPDELAQLAAATPVTLPVWTGAQTAAAPLEIASATRRDVRVDGVELGAAPLRVRVMPGRHTVEIADRAGRYRRAGWADVTASKPARLDVPPEAPAAPTGGVAQRKKQLDSGIDRAKLRACTRRLAKEGITGAYVDVEIGVDAAGAVNFMNLDSDLAGTTNDCVKAVLQGVQFGAGPAATWRERIEL